MKGFRAKLVLFGCLAFCPLFLAGNLLNSSQLVAQDTTQAEEAPQEKTRKPPRGRVPNGYGKIGISEKQKEEIYTIQATYKSQVDDLLQQLEQLKTEEAEAVFNVLTEDQKVALKKYHEGATARRRAASTSTE